MNPQQLQKMMKQAQQMQGKMQQAQAEIEAKEFSYTAGGGVLSLTMLGSKEITSIEIKEELLDVEEKDMLQDLIMTSINTLNKQIDEEVNSTMGQFTQGLPF